MGYRAVLFAVPTEELSTEELLARLPGAALTPDSWKIVENHPPIYFTPGAKPSGSQRHLYAAISSEADARRTGLRYMFVGANDRHWDYWYRFEFRNFVDRLGVTLVTLSHNDKEDIYFFERRGRSAPKLFWLMSAGALLGGNVDRIRCDYAQKGFARETLMALAAEPESRLTRAEYRAVVEHDDAITIGLREFFPRATYGEYLELLHAKRVWRFNTRDAPRLVARPSGLGPLLGRIPSADQIRRADLKDEAREWI